MEGMTLKEFRDSRISGHRGKGRVSNSYGVYDYYKFYRKNREKGPRWSITEGEYYALIRQVNQILATELIEKGRLELPFKMGLVEYRKVPRTVYQDKDGHYKSNVKINWDKTFELWYNDEQAYKDKTIVKYDTEDIAKNLYVKTKADFPNKWFYTFLPQKEISIAFIKRRPNGFSDIPVMYTKKELYQIKGLYDG